MGELFITVLVFIAVSGLAGVLLFVWIILNIVQLLRRAVSGRPQPSMALLPADVNTCAVQNCRAINPPAAHFCRRCGYPIGGPAILLPRQPVRPNLRHYQRQMLRDM